MGDEMAIAKRNEARVANFAPSTFEQALKFSEMVARSNFVPTAYRGKPEDVFLAIQMGAELGLAPMQSLQNITVINGKPSVYGDAALALVQCHPAYEWHKEFFDGDTAVFQIKRKGNEVHEVRFGTKDAKQAGLLGKQGPWTTYPERMKQWRARGFGLRDKFADALKGLITAEEAMDYPEPPKEESITDGSIVLQMPKGDEPTHREGNEHSRDNCEICTKAGIPSSYTCVVSEGHFMIRKGDRVPYHDAEHKSDVYCPKCREDFAKKIPSIPDAPPPSVMDGGGSSLSPPAPSQVPPAVTPHAALESREVLSGGASSHSSPVTTVSNELDEKPGEKGAATNSSGEAPKLDKRGKKYKFFEAMEVLKKSNEKVYRESLGREGYEHRTQVAEENYRKVYLAIKQAVGDSAQWMVSEAPPPGTIAATKPPAASTSVIGDIQALQAQVMKKFGFQYGQALTEFLCQNFGCLSQNVPTIQVSERCAFLELALVLFHDIKVATEVKRAAKIGFSDLHSFLVENFPKSAWLDALKKQDVAASKLHDFILDRAIPKPATQQMLDDAGVSF